MRNRISSIVGLALSLSLLLGAGAAAAIAQGYASNDSGLKVSMLAALSSQNSNTVQRATISNENHVVGVVTTLDNANVAVASNANQVLVQTSGQVTVYVSDIGGGISKGDLLVVSPLDGVLMKAPADTSQPIIALALQDVNFSGADGYPVSGGKTARITTTKVTLDHQGSVSSGQSQQSALTKLAQTITGKQVSTARLLAALLIFIAVLLIEGAVIYGAVSSSIVALGRNPLASKTIRHELTRIIAVALLVLIVGVAAVYGVLII